MLGDDYRPNDSNAGAGERSPIVRAPYRENL